MQETSNTLARVRARSERQSQQEGLLGTTTTLEPVCVLCCEGDTLRIGDATECETCTLCDQQQPRRSSY